MTAQETEVVVVRPQRSSCFPYPCSCLIHSGQVSPPSWCPSVPTSEQWRRQGKEIGTGRWGQDSRQMLLVQALCPDKPLCWPPFSKVRAPLGARGDIRLCRG